jgi:N-terminal domain of NWD NACHT-NTPase
MERKEQTSRTKGFLGMVGDSFRKTRSPLRKAGGAEGSSKQGAVSLSSSRLAVGSCAESSTVTATGRDAMVTEGEQNSDVASKVLSEPAPKEDLWERAYDKLREERASLVEDYERILKGSGNIPEGMDLKEQISAVVTANRKIMINKQWKFKWRNKPKKVRDQVDRIVGVVQAVQGIGPAVTSLDPVHAGLPWAGVCLLLPVS